MKALKAEELRKGNIVKFSRGAIEPVTVININDLDMGYLTLEGVELTEDWLLKFGFESGKIPAGLPAFRHPKLDATLVFYDGSFGIAGAKTQPHLDYVHQLQNLFFALTNSELNLK